jgi:multidrug resistance efflux pump
MLELLLCSMLTIFPDYLYRRYAQGKRLGKEITLYSVWFELRWGITSCLVLTVLLITVIFYNHPSTSKVILFFRTVPIVPEINGRVAEIYVGVTGPIAQGAPIFRLDSSKQEAATEAARRKIAEVDAETSVARVDLLKADGQLQEAVSAHRQTVDELETKQELWRRNPGNVPAREIERLQVLLEGRLGAVAAATAGKQTIEQRISSLLPAQKASAEAALAQSEVELDKTIIRAGVNGRIEQLHFASEISLIPSCVPQAFLSPPKPANAFYSQVSDRLKRRL